jgi:hypothetical protein
MGICFCPPACSRRRIPTRMRLFSCILDLQHAMGESPKDKGRCSRAIHLKGIFATAFHELHLCRRSHFACSAAKPPFLCILLAYGVGTLSQPVFRIHLEGRINSHRSSVVYFRPIRPGPVDGPRGCSRPPSPAGPLRSKISGRPLPGVPTPFFS